MARDGGSRLPSPDSTPDPLTPELAPFVVQARAEFERATDGLDHAAAIEHLEEAVARAAIAASRLGMVFPAPEPVTDALSLGDGDVVLVHRLDDPA